jgi:HSP20 family molecular chaperone IbpA
VIPHAEISLVPDDLRRSRHGRRKASNTSLTLPDAVDEEHIEASYHNGVLTINVPKTAESTRR